MTFNSRSLRNKYIGVTEFLNSNNCDICFITESWLKISDKGILAEVKDMGYNILFKSRKGRSGGGVCVLFKEYLDAQKCKLDTTYKTFELLEIVVKSQFGLFRVSTFYRTGKMSTQGLTHMSLMIIYEV